MTYKQTIAYLFKQLPMYQKQGKSAFKKDLTNIIKLCNALGNPQNKFKSIHIAGTNGKGTVSHILAAFFQKNGYKTGLYTSPHYKTFRERIKINGKYISKKKVVTFVEEHQTLITKIQPSFFEITVAMAFEFFANKKIEIAIVETGLGGRLDSTNIIKPLLSVITNISLDHTEMLGDTKKLIAAEKAGIIKPNTPVCIGKMDNETDKVFKNVAMKNKAPIYFCEKKIKIETITNKMDASIFKIDDKKFKCDLSGPFIKENLTTSFSAIKILQEINVFKDLKIKNFTKNIIKKTNFNGRWKILQKQPLIVADAAHNFNALETLFTFINKQRYKKVHCVIGFVNDKNLDKIISILPKDYVYYLCAAKIPRSLAVNELKKLIVSKNLTHTTYSSVNQSFKASKKRLNKKDLLLICGSSFVVAEVV